MKKIAILASLLFVVNTGSALADFAAGDTAGSLDIGDVNTATVKLSKGVFLDYVGQSTGLGYVVGTYHSSGTKTFASSSGDSKIWSKDGTAEDIPDTAPSGTESVDFQGEGWTAL